MERSSSEASYCSQAEHHVTRVGVVFDDEGMLSDQIWIFQEQVYL